MYHAVHQVIGCQQYPQTDIQTKSISGSPNDVITFSSSDFFFSIFFSEFVRSVAMPL